MKRPTFLHRTRGGSDWLYDIANQRHKMFYEHEIHKPFNIQIYLMRIDGPNGWRSLRSTVCCKDNQTASHGSETSCWWTAIPFPWTQICVFIDTMISGSDNELSTTGAPCSRWQVLLSEHYTLRIASTSVLSWASFRKSSRSGMQPTWLDRYLSVYVNCSIVGVGDAYSKNYRKNQNRGH